VYTINVLLNTSASWNITHKKNLENVQTHYAAGHTSGMNYISGYVMETLVVSLTTVPYAIQW